MKDSKLSTTKEEKDLGVLITDNLKPSSQCAAAVNKTMSALRWSKRSFHYLDIESFRILYKTNINQPNLLSYFLRLYALASTPSGHLCTPLA